MSNRIKRIGSLIRFPLIFLIIIGSTLALVAYGQGFIYDREQGGIVSGGLMVIDAQVNNASVSINGATVGTTPRRVRRPAGEYDVVLSAEGHRPWSKRLNVAEGALVDTQYPFLIPSNVATISVQTLESPPRHFSQSPNARLLAYVSEARPGELLLIDAVGESDSINFSLSEVAEDFQEIENVQWVRRTGQLFVVANGTSSRLAILFDVGRDSIELVGSVEVVGSGNIDIDNDENMYFINEGTLVRAAFDGGADTVVAESVRSFAIDDGTAVYLDEAYTVHLAGAVSNPELYQVGRSGEYDLSLHTYRNELVITIRNRQTDQLTIVQESNDFDSLSLPVAISQSVFTSPSGRFIVSRSGNHFLTYDLRTQQSHRFVFEGASTEDISWLGNYHMLLSTGSDVVIMEFDGENRERLASGIGYRVVGSRTNAQVFSIGENTVTSSAILQRSVLE